jgi:hypothetical protein
MINEKAVVQTINFAVSVIEKKSGIGAEIPFHGAG